MWMDPVHGGKTDDVTILFAQAALTVKRSVPYNLEYGTNIRANLSREFNRETAGRLRQEVRRSALPDSDLYELPVNNFGTGGLNPTITYSPQGVVYVNTELIVKPDNTRIRVQVA